MQKQNVYSQLCEVLFQLKKNSGENIIAKHFTYDPTIFPLQAPICMIIKKENSTEEECFLLETFKECDDFLNEKFPAKIPPNMKHLNYVWTDERIVGDYFGHVTKVIYGIQLIDEVRYETKDTWTVTMRETIELDPQIYVIQDLKTGLVLDIYKNKLDAAKRLRQGAPCLKRESCSDDSADDACIDCSNQDFVCLQREVHRS